jgi:hydrogenase expression/formation protein HypE
MTIDFDNGLVELAHGSGGRAMQELIQQLFIAQFDNASLRAGEDQATLNITSDRIVMATDSHVVSPLFFPGGNIGSLAVHGTINDVVMSGAKPLSLSVGFILEEGFPLKDLKRIVESMAVACKSSKVNIVTGDTKVVERGNADGIFINTTGIGVIEHNATLGANTIRPGDKIILSGTLGDHGMTIMALREKLISTQAELSSDSAALDGLVKVVLPFIDNIRCMRDPTRGGLAACLNELSRACELSMQIKEAKLKVRPEVEAYCEILGLDPLYLANEGKLVAICDPNCTDKIVSAMRAHPLGRDAAIIGEVSADSDCYIELETQYGGKRLIDWRYSDPLPRIC